MYVRMFAVNRKQQTYICAAVVIPNAWPIALSGVTRDVAHFLPRAIQVLSDSAVVRKPWRHHSHRELGNPAKPLFGVRLVIE